MPDIIDITSLANTLQGDAELLEESLDLDLGGYTMRIRSNHLPLLERLAVYFAHLAPGTSEADIEIVESRAML